MKSILHVGLVAPNYSNSGLMKAFFENSFSEYTLFDFQLKTFEFDRDTMRRMLIQEAERMRPDMIFMQIQGSEILDMATFNRLSEISFTVNYTFDKRSKEQSEWLYNLSPYVGLLCLSNQEDVDECNSRGYKNVMLLHSSCDMDAYRPLGDGPLDPEYRGGVVFVGNNYENTMHQFPGSKERSEMVALLRYSFPGKFMVFGNDWQASKIINGNEEVKVYLSSLIAINQNNFDAENYTSDRLWRIMATGALCLTKYFKGIEKLFNEGVHLSWWFTFDDLKQKLQYYLDNPDIACKIGVQGVLEVRKNHTWGARIKEMLTFIKDNIMDTRTYAIPFNPNTDLCLKYGAHVIDGNIPNPSDQHFDGRTCSCGKLKWVWEECGCANKEYQLRAHENI